MSNIRWYGPLECDLGDVELIEMSMKTVSVKYDLLYYVIDRDTGDIIDITCMGSCKPFSMDDLKVRNKELSVREQLFEIWKEALQDGSLWANQQELGNIFIDKVLHEYDVRKKD